MFATWKRSADIVASAVLLIGLLPLLGMIMLAISLDSSGKVIFMQERVGRNGKRFRLAKFRTMSHAAPSRMAASQFEGASDFITPVGRFLRRTSLDELPQLWNVLKGDMSFIGPRPVIPLETTLLEARHRNGADTVRPGLSGLAQIRGRNELTDREKARYDGFYAQHCSLRLDAYIAWHTIGYVLRGEGIREGIPPSPATDESMSAQTKTSG